MITFIDEEKETGNGIDWIEIDSQHSDICTISVGNVEFDGDGQATTNYASFALIGFDIFRLSKFIQTSTLGDALILEWCSDDEKHSQVLSVVDFKEKFKVAVTEGENDEEGKFVESYSYDVERARFVQAVEEMHNLYGSIQKEQAERKRQSDDN